MNDKIFGPTKVGVVGPAPPARYIYLQMSGMYIYLPMFGTNVLMY